MGPTGGVTDNFGIDDNREWPLNRRPLVKPRANAHREHREQEPSQHRRQDPSVCVATRGQSVPSPPPSAILGQGGVEAWSWPAWPRRRLSPLLHPRVELRVSKPLEQPLVRTRS